MPNVFISYRREDSGGHAGRLCDRLTARFGDSKVFMDLQDIAPGQNFAQSIDERIAVCDCVIAVIGPRWMETIQKRDARAEDFVQHEISAALHRGITVIPVLVGGARMPSPEQLPPAMSELRHRNAFEIRDERFNDDTSLLGDAIARLGSGNEADGDQARRSPVARLAPIVMAAGIVAMAGAAYLLTRPGDTASTAPEGAATTPATSAVPAPAPTPAPANPARAPAVARALDGDWIAEMQKEGQPPFRIRLTFVVTGRNISGMVRYPTGDAPILDARLAGSDLTFHTSHVPQFESTPATIRFQAAVSPDEIVLTTTDDNGIAKGVARRRPPDKQ